VGTYNVEKSSLAGPKFSLPRNIKYQNPKDKEEMSMNLPVSYLNDENMGTHKVKNYSLSNLPKQQRFKLRELAEKELSESVGPANYNLSDTFSINNKTKIGIIKKIREKRISKIRNSYSRFDDCTYYPEKERLMKGCASVSPDRYDPLPAFKAAKIRRTYQAAFSREKRGLEKQEAYESLSPAKYNIKSATDLKYTIVPKGVGIGCSKRRLEFKVPTY